MGSKVETERRIGLFGATCIGVGAIVGGGILALAGTALEQTGLSSELVEVLARARANFEPREYDCIGCKVCWPPPIARSRRIASVFRWRTRVNMKRK